MRWGTHALQKRLGGGTLGEGKTLGQQSAEAKEPSRGEGLIDCQSILDKVVGKKNQYNARLFVFAWPLFWERLVPTGLSNAKAELCPSVPAASGAAEELCLSRERRPHLGRGCWKLAGPICSLERQIVLTVTGFPFLSKDELLRRAGCLAGTEQASQTHLPPPLTFIPHRAARQPLAERVRNSIRERYLMRGRGKGYDPPRGDTLPTPGWQGMDLPGVRVGCLFGLFGVVYGQAADSGAAVSPSRPAGGGGPC